MSFYFPQTSVSWSKNCSHSLSITHTVNGEIIVKTRGKLTARQGRDFLLFQGTSCLHSQDKSNSKCWESVQKKLPGRPSCCNLALTFNLRIILDLESKMPCAAHDTSFPITCPLRMHLRDHRQATKEGLWIEHQSSLEGETATLLDWPKSSFTFSVTLYGRTQRDFLANSIFLLPLSPWLPL